MNRNFNFSEASFEQFRAEIEAQIKRRLTLDEQDEWEQYFNKKTDILRIKKNEVVVHNNKIDDMVYSLYDISEEQKVMIEKSLVC